MNYKGKVVWITGASSGIGAALAKKYSFLGAKLILSSREKASLNKIKHQCSMPENVVILPFDLKVPFNVCSIVCIAKLVCLLNTA